MPASEHLVGPDDVPETVLLKNLALITIQRGSDCQYWVAATDQGEPEGTYMIVCVLGPQYIADLQAAMASLAEIWDEREKAAEAGE